MIRIRTIWERTSTAGLAGLALWIALAAALLSLPSQILDFALPVVPLAQLASSPEIQTRAALGDLPYRVLIDAHALLPPGARVLLVTDGSDVRHREYTTFHRALYYLTPRSVWWLSPAPHDGTWEARWWQSAPLTESTISEFAQSKNVDFILLLTNQDLFPFKKTLARWDSAKLVPMQDRGTATSGPYQPEFAPPDSQWRVIAILAVYFFNGALALYILARTGFVISRVEWFALSWSLGVGLVTFLLFGALAVGLSLDRSIWIVAASSVLGAVLIGLDRFASRSGNEIFSLQWAGLHKLSTSSPRAGRTIDLAPRDRAATRSHRSATLQTAFLLVILFTQICFVALIALGRPLTFWDSWVTWSIKARALFLDQALSPAILTDPSHAVTHLDYPLLIPLAEAGMYQVLGAPDDRFVGWIALGFFIALIAFVYSAARTFGATGTRALLAAAVVSALPTVSLLAAQNYADIPLAVYGVVTVTYLLRWIERAGRGALVVAILGAACLGWTKREGLVLALAVSFAALILFPRDSRARHGSLACVLVSGLVAISWALWLTAQGTTNTDLMPLTLSNLLQNLHRLPTILSYFAITLTGAQWAFVWVCAAVLFLFRLARRSDTSYDLYLLSPLLYVAILATSYLFSDYAPYNAHLASSGYRLVAHVTPFIVIWLAVQRAPASAQLHLDTARTPPDLRGFRPVPESAAAGQVAPDPKGFPHAPAKQISPLLRSDRQI